FSIEHTSSARRAVHWSPPGDPTTIYNVYANCNVSIYSAAPCNGRCPFCVEKVRPASECLSLERVKQDIDDERYFKSLERACNAVSPLNPSVSITGGEPSIDPRLPRILETICHHDFRKRTITTNGSGLLDNGLLHELIAAKFSHLNISRAHFSDERNQALMQLDRFFSNERLGSIISATRGTCLRPRLSCVLLTGEIDSLEAIIDYLEWTSRLGVDNVVFRQLMKFDARSRGNPDPVLQYSQQRRVLLDPILAEIYSPATGHEQFEFKKQVVGYYYYVEVYEYRARNHKKMDVVLEIADLSFIDKARHAPGGHDTIHEFVVHPSGSLNSGWIPTRGIVVQAEPRKTG
nr:radical SAM protein [Candidatus Sigynarchaeota archaeon]